MGRFTNTILQAAFFRLNEQIMPYSTSLELMKDSARHTYARKGQDVVDKNILAIETGASLASQNLAYSLYQFYSLG